MTQEENERDAKIRAFGQRTWRAVSEATIVMWATPEGKAGRLEFPVPSKTPTKYGMFKKGSVNLTATPGSTLIHCMGYDKKHDVLVVRAN